MYKTVLLLISGIFSAGFSYSQENYTCGQNEKMKNFVIHNNTKKEQVNSAKSDEYIIPVVFHVLHLNGPENVSDDQINYAMEALNEDFNKQNWDTMNVVPAFADNIADIGVTFKLAKLDPDGNPTTGINRIYTNLTNYGWEDSSKINQWPPHKYLNVWVSKSLNGYAAAYAWYPEYAEYYPELDGIMMQYDYLGYTGTAGEYARHVLTHEVGHYLNLKHTWDDMIGSGPCGDDEVPDTPITQSSGCDLDLSGCNPPVIENVQNFMTGSYCNVMFTEGQKERMINCLNSPVGGRSNLWQHENLVETGLIENTAAIAAVSKDGFYVYPNPATDELMVSVSQGVFETVLLYDLFGNTIDYDGVVQNDQLRINVSGLAAGTYFISHQNRNEKIVILR